MHQRTSLLVTAAAALTIGYLMGGPFASAQQAGSAASTAAVPNQKGGEDVFGPYEIVADWPKDLSTIPGHEGWTFGAQRGASRVTLPLVFER